MVTKDDEVYAIGSNAAGCLGLGDLQSTLSPKKVEVLCNKNVKGNQLKFIFLFEQENSTSSFLFLCHFIFLP